MDDEIAKIVTQMPRKGAEAEPIGEFPIEDRPAGKIEGAIPLQARVKHPLDEAEVESLSKPKRLTEAEQAERKRRLPPLSLTAKRKPKPGVFNTFDYNRRDMVQGRIEAERTEQAKAELTQAVRDMPMRWERGKSRAK